MFKFETKVENFWFQMSFLELFGSARYKNIYNPLNDKFQGLFYHIGTLESNEY